MALQVYSTSAWTSIVQNSVLSQRIMTNHSVVCVAGDYSQITKRKSRQSSMGLRIRASLDSTAAASAVNAAVAKVGEVTEVGYDTFWPIVNSAGDKTVVLDMYTQWCGPCKVMAPKFKLLSEKYDDVLFLKLDCNTENRPLAKELGIKVVPTFKILKGGEIVKEVTGAKYDDLVAAIENARSSS